jgi:hypothetical protein
MPASRHLDKETQEILAELQPETTTPEKNIKVRTFCIIVKNLESGSSKTTRVT